MKEKVKRFTAGIITCLIISVIAASTPVFGAVTSQHISTDTTWSGTVNISTEIYIDDGVTLTILPGTEVIFTAHIGLQVQGRLLAVGTKADSIKFFPSSTTTGWDGILFDGTPSTNDTSKIIYCVISYSKANTDYYHGSFGGAIAMYFFDKLLLENCNLNHNYAAYLGGAVYCDESSPVIRNNIFANNNGVDDGGAIALETSNCLITDNLFINNLTDANGGAINFVNSSPHITNNTFSGNYAGYSGGAISIDYHSGPVFTNCIFYNDSSGWGNEVTLSDNAYNPDFYYCLLEGGLAGFSGLGGAGQVGDYENNLDTNPLFEGSGIHPFSLQPASPCVNTGKPDMTGQDVTALDLAGNPRIRNKCNLRIDMGAYEYQGISSYSFSGAISVNTTWCADTVNITGDVSINNGVTLTVVKGVVVYFQGASRLTVNGCIVAQGDSLNYISFTTIDQWPTWGWGGMIFDNVAPANDTSKLIYCRFESGNATDRGGGGYFGGAVYVHNFSKLVISNCDFQNNFAGNGGALYLSNTTLHVTHCSFSGNQSYTGAAIEGHNATLTISGNHIHNNNAIWGNCNGSLASHGGGIYLNTCTAEVHNNMIENNHADCKGGGIFATGSTLTLTNDTISYNTSDDCTGSGGGGGLSCYNSTITATGNLFSHNNASWGGGIFLSGVEGQISNNTITENTIGVSGCIISAGGGIVFENNSNPVFSNNIVTYNSASHSAGIDLSYSHPDIINNLIAYNIAGNAGAGLEFYYSSPLLFNNTICNNFSQNVAGGFYFQYNSSPVIRNNIIYGNNDVHNSGNQVFIYDNSNQPNFYYCDIQRGRPGFGGYFTNYTGDFENNIDLDPKFENSGDFPYQIQPGSPCLNTGDPATTTGTAGEYDLAGNPRIQNGRIDIGTYETGSETNLYAGSAIHFTQSNDSIILDNESRFNFGNTFTVEFWLKIDAMSTDYHTIIQKGDEWEVRMFYDDEISIIEFGINENSVFGYYQTTGSVLLNKWNHIAGVFDLTPGNEYVTIYLNGQQGSEDMAETLSHDDLPVTIGSSILGQMDELRIWQTARSIQEIREDMHLMVAAGETGLVAYHQFNGNIGTTVVDITGGNNGTLCNMSVPGCFVKSTMPAGAGVSNQQIVGNEGIVDFTGTDLTLNVSSIWSTDTIVVTRLDTIPNTDPPGANMVFGQYWIVEEYGDGSLEADLTFTVIQDLTPEDAVHLDLNRLYHRESNSDSYWTFIQNASSVNVSGNSITFDDVDQFSQFCVPRKISPGNYAGDALLFNGVDEFVTFNPLYDSGPQELTFEAWVWPEDLSTSDIFYHGDNGEFELGITGSVTSFRIKYSDNSWYTLTAPPLEANTWQHLCAVWVQSAQFLKFYINGELVQTHGTPDLPMYDPGTGYLPSIGSYNRGGARFFKGKLDEIRVWNVARTIQQIRENMHLTLSGGESGLIGYWQFNDGTGNKTEDCGGNHDGTLQNMDGQNWITSSIPAGGGISNTQIISSAGMSEFSGTGIQMNFTEKAGTDTIVATRIDTAANILPVADTNFSSQYWVVHKYGNGSLNANIQFTINEDVSAYDEVHPQDIALLKRTCTSENLWVFNTKANSASAQDDEILFNGISSFSQFAIAKGLHPDIALNKDSIVFSRTPSTLQAADSVLIYNYGTDTLIISDISHNNSQFELSASAIVLLSGEQYYLRVTYHPASDGLVYDTLHISSNDPDEPIVNVNLRGNGYVIDTWAGTALSFNGSSKYVQVADNNSLDLTNNYTIEAWIYPKGFNFLGGIVSKYQSTGGNGYYVRLTDSSPYSGLNFDGKSTAPGLLELNKWYHIAAVNDNGTRILYVDGVSQPLNGTADAINSNSDALCIGVDYLENGRYYNGKIDEVRIWNVVRNEQEIRENMHLTLKGNESGLVSYWQLNQGSGTSAVDKIRGNNGSLHNFTGPDWIESTIPAGGGTSFTSEVTGTGQVDFSGTGINIDFTAKTGTDQIVVTRIDTAANVNPSGQKRPFDRQYWVVHQYGSGTLTADLTFTVHEDITTEEEIYQHSVKLFKRTGNADTDWLLTDTSISVNAINNTATFQGLTSFSQMMLTGKSWPDSVPGTALSFNGENEYVTYGPLYGTSPEALTIEAWVYPENLSSSVSYLIYHGDQGEFGLFLDENATTFHVKLSDHNWYNVLTPALELNTWQHLCGVWDSEGSLKIYINGDLPDSIAIPALPLFDPGSGYLPSIGANNRNSSFFNGQLDEIRVWDRVRSITEIRGKIYATLDGTEEGLVAYWQFNDGSGTSTVDVAGSYTGTLINMDDGNWVTSTAPLPFQSISNGNWSNTATWLEGQKVPVKDWSRVNISNEVTLDEDKTVIVIRLNEGGSLRILNPKQLTVTGN